MGAGDFNTDGESQSKSATLHNLKSQLTDKTSELSGCLTVRVTCRLNSASFAKRWFQRVGCQCSLVKIKWLFNAMSLGYVAYRHFAMVNPFMPLSASVENAVWT